MDKSDTYYLDSYQEAYIKTFINHNVYKGMITRMRIQGATNQQIYEAIKKKINKE